MIPEYLQDDECFTKILPSLPKAPLDIKPFFNRLLTLPPDLTRPTDIIQSLLEYQRNRYKFIDPPQAFIAEDLPIDMAFQGLVSSLPRKCKTSSPSSPFWQGQKKNFLSSNPSSSEDTMTMPSP
ncbi:hypothetical protein COLO4_20864 [Corchorus olitorius]|uniref:Uncharacterized protein n=1 Tax=Corchorus olitorius TaxID=93759 RepID=A0A1R3IWI7_9ROSI|nr:hypothetical protein COLO4_20864 [Corchorus olitorius]